MLVRKKPPKHKEKVRLGNALYAYHRTWTEGKPFTDYYFTAKKHPKVGHNIYVISGDEQKKPEYFLEGLYVVSGIGRRHKNKRKLLLTPLIKYVEPPCISRQHWFDNVDFRGPFYVWWRYVNLPLGVRKIDSTTF